MRDFFLLFTFPVKKMLFFLHEINLITLKNLKKMFDKKTFVTVLIALVAFKIISNLFLDSAIEKFVPSNFEATDGE